MLTGVGVDYTLSGILPEASIPVDKMTQSVQVTPKLPGESSQVEVGNGRVWGFFRDGDILGLVSTAG